MNEKLLLLIYFIYWIAMWILNSQILYKFHLDLNRNIFSSPQTKREDIYAKLGRNNGQQMVLCASKEEVTRYLFLKFIPRLDLPNVKKSHYIQNL